jgi:hypothetical protein
MPPESTEPLVFEPVKPSELPLLCANAQELESTL